MANLDECLNTCHFRCIDSVTVTVLLLMLKRTIWWFRLSALRALLLRQHRLPGRQAWCPTGSVQLSLHSNPIKLTRGVERSDMGMYRLLPGGATQDSGTELKPCPVCFEVISDLNMFDCTQKVCHSCTYEQLLPSPNGRHRRRHGHQKCRDVSDM